MKTERAPLKGINGYEPYASGRHPTMRVCCITKSLPYAGIPHAGGEYVLRHVEALQAMGYEVTLVAPGDPRNVAVRDRAERIAPVHLLGPEKTHFQRVCDRVYAWWNPGKMPKRYSLYFEQDSAALGSVSSADIVEVQWTEMMSVLPSSKTVLSGIHRPILFVHDILWQREVRHIASYPRWSLAKRITAKLRLRRTVKQECAAFRCASLLCVFSNSDASLVSKHYGRRDTFVLRPPFGFDAVRPRSELNRNDSFSIIMVAAFGRPENEEGALWFVRNVWPRVLKSIPNATLTLVGSSPHERLRRVCRGSDRIVITGYVESIEEYYSRARVAVVPLLRGAGLKFKVLEALVRDVPVVCTTVGAEGIDVPRSLDGFIVHDSPASFAAAVADILQKRDKLQTECFSMARKTYGINSYSNALKGLIEVVNGSK